MLLEKKIPKKEFIILSKLHKSLKSPSKITPTDKLQNPPKLDVGVSGVALRSQKGYCHIWVASQSQIVQHGTESRFMPLGITMHSIKSVMQDSLGERV